MSRTDSFNLCDYFLNHSRLSVIGNQPAILYRGEPIKYADLRGLTDIWAARLVETGIVEGDRVVLLLYDSPLLIAAFLAGTAIGAISVPVNTMLRADEIQFIIRDCGARLIVCETELIGKLAGLEPDENGVPTICAVDGRQWSGDEIEDRVERVEYAQTASDSAAFMLYTSGSTGRPKGALHRQCAPRETALTYGEEVLQLSEADRIYSSSRLFFAYGLGNSLTFPLAAGATVILDCERPTAERIGRIFVEQQPTVFFGVPAIYRALLDYKAAHGLETTSLRLCVSAGEALPARIFADWQKATGLAVLDGIGSTEMLHIFISNRASAARAGTSGQVVAGYKARLLEPAGGEVAANELGNLWVNGASAFLGYWNRPDLTALAVQEGWVKTGDIYRCDEEGFYTHIGRSDDCFKVSGLWVSPIEVEEVLASHTAVAEVAVVSATGADGLATARAFVVIRTEGDDKNIIAELKKFAVARLPRYKVPSEIIAVAALPRTATGKVQRFKLRQTVAGQASEEQG